MSSRIAAGFIVYRWLEENLQYLLLQTSYGSHHWTPPKGHVDPGESIECAASRETEEECGLSENDLRIDWNFRKESQYKIPDGTPKTVTYFLAEQIPRCSADGSSLLTPVHLSSEHQDYKWLPLVDACEWSVFPDMQKILAEAESYILATRQSK